jgi:hypothetical protein
VKKTEHWQMCIYSRETAHYKVDVGVFVLQKELLLF